MLLEFNQRAELPIANSDGDEIFRGGSTIDVSVTDEDSETISFNWEGLAFEEVPKLFFENFAE